MTKPIKLTPTQEEIVDAMRVHGGNLERWRGGFWTYPGVEVVGHRSGDMLYPVPAVSWQMKSIEALVRLGVVEVSPPEHPTEATTLDAWRGWTHVKLSAEVPTVVP